MIKTNCELPNSLLIYNNELNDYDFVLFHLYKKDEAYKNFYKNQRVSNPERLMILDNSAYEFFIKGEELDLQEFYETIIDLKPNYYILPDVLMDKDKTIYNTTSFVNQYYDLIKINSSNSKPLAVLQGNSERDFDECIEVYKKLNIWAIAIPFHNSFFKDRLPDVEVAMEFAVNYDMTDDVRYAMGRVDYVLKNYMDKLFQFQHVHILGSHCPLEKMFYNMCHTMDTGYPVKLGIAGEFLFQEDKKPNIIIDDFLHDNLDQYVREKIIINIMKFKNI